MMNSSNPLFAALQAAGRDAIGGLMVGMPGHIVVFDNQTQRAQVQCGIQRRLSDGTHQTIPVLINVPVKFSGSSEWAVFHELPAGTEGYIHFSQRSVDAWLDMGGPAPPVSPSMFNASDAFFSPGYRSAKTAIPNLPASGVGMSNLDGSVRIHLTHDGIVLSVGNSTLSLTESGMTYSGPRFTNTGETTLNARTHITQGGLAVGNIEFASHTHGGVERGNAKSDGPQ
ncbi:Gp138 family membrane-puncturing spike protein [Phytobacter diazotrophicus]|uniref:Gp138 family membrane-puncturing spike protein n=2 Tax=Enterobacteriaceae TaxID=543 RepID=A0ABW1Q1I0_9ENTR|nr:MULTISPECIES: Gp138 family membrane-puncturing spike protein [Phytobacter]MDU4152737.1 Gp138 family membrane-puncturing spike protein [Enterobacteriaceae bacterium]PXW60666.1 hypothetical protein DFO55_10276 [Grimontella sp. AG753]MDU4353034.1 Gp138 family membrane-puncturing spike protein [Phytobacter diazotrophicus]MDU7131347.1 Gp138 family membrane-puncturing spike protein [Enterobacteriaceae bacterium]MDU7377502.1 Gp138 family membrane-puncturing spike protein [Enterobacteriaceae bacter